MHIRQMPNHRHKDKVFIGFWIKKALKAKLIKEASKKGLKLSTLLIKKLSSARVLLAGLVLRFL